MFQNAAHDSICGCSRDEVSAQVLVRYAEAEQIAAS
jgi:alpha-mannosidase